MLKMSDIAERAGVSSSTVSFVLNDRHAAARISEATRQKVLSAAEEMGYRANHGARAMRTGNTRMIGIIGGDIGQEHVGRMIAGALEEIESHDYTLKLLPMPWGGSLEAAQGVMRRSSELRLQGAVAMHLSAQAIKFFQAEAKRYKYPLLLLDTRAIEGAPPAVVSDDESGIRAGLDYLIGLGHRRIAMISAAPEDATGQLRQSAFSQILRQQGLVTPGNYLQSGDFTDHRPNVEAARALLQLPAAERPTALFCMGDLIAMAALQVAGEVELRVPDELSVIGFADFAMAKFANPPLTTVRQDFGAMGSAAARQILQLCGQSHEPNNGASPLFDAPFHRVPTQLIVRGTCGPVPF